MHLAALSTDMKPDDDPFREIERVFDQLAEFRPPTGDDVPVDVLEEDEAFVVVADLPGYETDDIEVELHDERRLHIAAERTTERDYEDEGVVRRERHSEQVSRTLTLPGDVVSDETTAEYENGVLTVRLGKQASENEGTDIPVN